jgi:monoamine oxidase
LELYERGGARVCWEGGALKDCSGEQEELAGPMEKLEDFSGPDMSFAEYLDREGIEGEERWSAAGHVEGFNAADHRVISVASLGVQQKAEDSIEGDRVFRLRGGYDLLPKFLAERIVAGGGKICLKTAVREIRWSAGRVEVVTEGRSFVGRQVVIALPLGVLQGGVVSIVPRPEGVFEAAEGLRMGQARRFTLCFRERFWEGLEPQPAMGELSFLFAFEAMPPLTGCYTHDWQGDLFALGSYSYVAAGGIEASRRVAEPVEGTLFFAGEHTDVTGHWGTVHAAMRSGLRAAAQICS